MVVNQKATESFTSCDFTGGASDFITGLDDLVDQPLVISFLVKMRQEFGAGVSQRPLTEEDHSVPDTRISGLSGISPDVNSNRDFLLATAQV